MDARAAERLLVEARAAASLDHPNTCTVYEVGQLEGGPFIAMAYYPGETLAQRLRGRALPWQEALRIAAQITRGLAAAHQRGIVHRDVKPANVLITVDATVKLLDFGIARVPDVHLTSPGFAPGTTAYMSPEQITSGACDARSDLWFLGVLLHELCTGEQPIRGSTTPALLAAIMTLRPTLPSSLRPGIPAVVDRIVVRLLQKNADARYASAAALLLDLERALQAAHESSHPPTEPGTPASVELLSRRETLATPSGGTAPVAGPRRRWMQPSAIGAVVVATLGIVGWLLTRDRFGVDPDRVAVVPFVYRSGADSLQLRCFGSRMRPPIRQMR
jgi:serine/threonine-protein kinase